jgi:hypothetical protein
LLPLLTRILLEMFFGPLKLFDKFETKPRRRSPPCGNAGFSQKFRFESAVWMAA